MKCPMCLGKGYATDEDIKEYPHRCLNCNGKGFYSVDWQKVRCEVCNGSGKKPMTNEEWFCGLSTEEKADFMSRVLGCSNCPIPKDGRSCMGTYSGCWHEIIKWLKQPHREE